MTSWPLWLVLTWMMITGSRPVSFWFSGGIRVASPTDYLEGSPLDRNIFLLLIIAGILTLLNRRVSWDRMFRENRWFLVFIIYCGISILWSDYPFVAMKRWIKDLGHIVMVMIIITEKDPGMALKAVFARFINFAAPLSIVLIKYFSDLGRVYNRWNGEVGNCGITTTNNLLGSVMYICGLFLIWNLLEMRRNKEARTGKLDVLSQVVLLAMVLWLVILSDSSTGLVCLIIGTGILLIAQTQRVNRYVKNLGAYTIAFAILALLVYLLPSLFQASVGLVGRDVTLTGRTDLWAELLKAPINVLIGDGYQSFWLGSFAEHMWELYYFHPNQAHNGYLETYLNGGLVGLFLLITALIYTGRKLKKAMLIDLRYSAILFAFFVTALFYNFTEALFNRLSLVWFILIVAALDYQNSYHVVTKAVPGKNVASDKNAGRHSGIAVKTGAS